MKCDGQAEGPACTGRLREEACGWNLYVYLPSDPGAVGSGCSRPAPGLAGFRAIDTTSGQRGKSASRRRGSQIMACRGCGNFFLPDVVSGTEAARRGSAWPAKAGSLDVAADSFADIPVEELAILREHSLLGSIAPYEFPSGLISLSSTGYNSYHHVPVRGGNQKTIWVPGFIVRWVLGLPTSLARAATLEQASRRLRRSGSARIAAEALRPPGPCAQFQAARCLLRPLRRPDCSRGQQGKAAFAGSSRCGLSYASSLSMLKRKCAVE